MKKIEEITQADFEAFERHKNKRDAYAPNEVAELDNLMRTYVNRWHSTCSGCGNSLRDAKDSANQWLAHNRDRIVQILTNTEPTPTPAPAPQNKNKRKY